MSPSMSRRSFLKCTAALAVGVSIAQSLAACQVAPVAPESSSSGLPAAEPVNLVVETYQWDEAGFKEWMEWINVRLVEEHPNVTVEKRSAPYTEYWDKILVKAQSGTLGDVFQLSAPVLDQWLAMGGISAMNEYLDTEIAQQQMHPAVWQRVARDGQMMGVPTLHTTSQVMIYNVKHFEEAGVPVRGAGEHEAWLEDAVKLTDAPNRYGVVVHTIATNQLNEDLNKFVIAWNTQYSLPDGTPTVTAPEFVDAIAFYRKIVESGATPIGTEKTIYRPMSWDGKISQLIDGSWVFGMAMNSGAAALSELSAAPLPFPSQRGNLSFNLYNMYAQTQVPDMAAAWLGIAWSEEGAVQFAEKTGSPHAHQITYSDELLGRMPWLPAYQKVMATDPVPDPNPGFAIVRGEADDIIRRWADRAITTGDLPAQEACENMQKELEELSARNEGKTF